MHTVLQRTLFIAFIFVLHLPLRAVESKKPFGKGDALPYGTKPSLSQEDMNSQLIEFYRRWKGTVSGIEDVAVDKGYGDGYLAQYTSQGNSKPVYVIKGNVTGGEPAGWKKDSLKAVSSSEATGYGMIVFALMGGGDVNAQKYFDGLLNLYLRNKTVYAPKGTELSTMSWVLPSKYDVKGTQPERSGSATDGDLDIAYGLLLAHKQWGTPSKYANTDKSYLEIAMPLIKDIHTYIISSKTKRVLMGDSFSESHGGSSSKSYGGRYNHTSTRPSDWLITHLRVFNEYYPSKKWREAIDEIYKTLETVSNPETGLVPDFVEDIKGKAVPALRTVPYEQWYQDETGAWKPDTQLCFLENKWDDKYGSNACRVPWRLALEYGQYGTKEAKAHLEKMANWSLTIKSRRLRLDWDRKDWYTYDGGFKISTFPTSIFHGYELDGTPKGYRKDPKNWDLKAPYLSMPFIAPLGFSHMARKGGQKEVDATWKYIIGNFGGDHTEDDGYTCYFGDSIGLLTLLMMSGNWWIPHK